MEAEDEEYLEKEETKRRKGGKCTEGAKRLREGWINGGMKGTEKILKRNKRSKNGERSWLHLK